MRHRSPERRVAARFFASLAAVCGALGLLCGAAWSTDLYVNPDGLCGGNLPCFTTIQAALAAAAPTGDVIHIAAGTYAGPGGIGIGVTLLGPNAGISPNGGGRVAEAVINSGNPSIRVSTTDPVVIQGLEFNGTGQAVDSYTTGANVTLRRNIFKNITTQAFFFANANLITFDDNYLTAIAADQEGLFIAGNWDGSTGTVVSLTGNVWENSLSTGMNLSSVSGVITGNRFTNIQYYAILLANSSGNVTIANNKFDGIVNPSPGSSSTWGAGVRFYTPSYPGPVTISDNEFLNSYNGIGVRGGSIITGLPITVTNNRFAGNTYGIRNDGTGTLAATCNWWNHILGPNDAPGNPSPGDPVLGAVSYIPWLAGAPPAACNQYGPNNVAAVADTCISTVHPCETADVIFTRLDPTPMRGYSVTFHLSSNLTLCGTLEASITKGPYLLSAAGPNGTVMQLVDNGSGSYTVDEAILGTPCGALGTGVLFRVRVTSVGSVGTGTITVDDVTARDCFNVPVVGVPGAPGSVPFDSTLPAAIADLAAAQLRTGNDTDGTTKIRLTFTPPGDAAGVEVYRAPFGNYPEYDDAPNAGAVPAVPSYPPGAPWSRTSVTASGQTDELGPVLAGNSHLEVAGTYTATNWTDPRTNYAYRLGGTAVGKNNHNVPPGPPAGFPTGSMDPNLATLEWFRSPKGGTITVRGTFVTPLTQANFATEGVSGTGGQYLTVGLINQPKVASGMAGYNSQMFNSAVGAAGNAYLVFFKDNASSNVVVAMEDHIAGNVGSPDKRYVASVSSYAIQFQDGIDKTGATVATGGRMRYALDGGTYGPWDDNSHDFRDLTALQLGAYTVDGGVLNADLGPVTASIRDFWYYVAFVKDACGNVSAVSNRTGGTLNYHLGDVSDAVVQGQGNNRVLTEDMSFLGSHYAITIASGSPFAPLDVGPTTTNYIDGRPLTDNRIQFEDLILFAINYNEVSKARPDLVPAARDEISVLVPAATERGQEFLARVWLRGTGKVQGLSAQLAWNPAAVEPVGVERGELLAALGGIALSPGPGGVDVAVLGVGERGLVGEGVLANVRFRTIGDGEPDIRVASADARDPMNHHVDMLTGGPANDVPAGLPHVTALLPNVPNPFNPTTRIAYTLSSAGWTEIDVYTVAGRHVRNLVAAAQAAGLHETVWDGTDDHSVRAASGTYYVRLQCDGVVRTRPIVMLK